MYRILKQLIPAPLNESDPHWAKRQVWVLKLNSEELLNGYKIGFELLIFNGLLTYLGFWLIAKKSDEKD